MIIAVLDNLWALSVMISEQYIAPPTQYYLANCTNTTNTTYLVFVKN
jgi:hypothetical protein